MAKTKSLRLTVIIRQLTINGIEDESVNDYYLEFEKGQKENAIQTTLAHKFKMKFLSDPFTYDEPIDVLHIGIEKKHSLVIVTY